MNKLIPDLDIEQAIYVIRGQKVMLDEDLARLYGVETKVLNQAVRRNKDRFPENFMFQLTIEEYKSLRSQIVTSKRGGRKYIPFAFTEHGGCHARKCTQKQTSCENEYRNRECFREATTGFVLSREYA